MPTLPRPELSLVSILGYAFFAFVFGLILTPWFISFLRSNRLGKQLRVETVDGREASIFRQYHQKKFGTPTMGGLLIWGSIVLTVLSSRVLALMGVVHNSLLQRGEMYVPLLTLLSLGIVGAIDDYLNIVGTDEQRIHDVMPKIKKFLVISMLIIVAGILLFLFFGTPNKSGALLSPAYLWNTIGLGALLLLSLLVIIFVAFSGVLVDKILAGFMISQGKKKGLGWIPKLSSLLIISLLGALWFYFKLDRNAIDIPFYGIVTLGWWYIPLFVFVIVGTANAVNVTDGLDGLAGGLLIIAFGAFAVLAYISNLYIVAGFCAVTAGAVAAFLWHNVPPALFYMGDTGALALGGTLGVIALMTDRVLILPLVGFVFVIEMLSVIIQLTSKRLRGGKKIFKAAPIHHHFEALEWGESKVTMRMWIIGAFVAIIGVIVGIMK